MLLRHFKTVQTRLARNVHFISGLMESKVDFLAVDMPEANRLTIHVLAAVAEHEREMISQKTKAALDQTRARGTKCGSPRPIEALERANATTHLKLVPGRGKEPARHRPGTQPDN